MYSVSIANKSFLHLLWEHEKQWNMKSLFVQQLERERIYDRVQQEKVKCAQRKTTSELKKQYMLNPKVQAMRFH